MFADDTNLIYSHDSANEVQSVLNYELEKLNQWFEANKLSLNVKKTNYMVFNNNRNQTFEIKINGDVIIEADVVKYLGIYIDHKLSWSNHIKLVETKIAKSLSILYKCKFILPSSALYELYSTLVLPYLYYCSEIWGNTYKSRLKKLIILQKKAIRSVCKVKYNTHTAPLFLQLKTLQFLDIIDYKSSIIMYNAYNKCLPAHVQSYFNNDTNKHTHSTRQCNDLNIRYVRTKEKQMCISFQGIKLWNNIEDEIKYLPNIESFKYFLKQSLIQGYAISMSE